MPRHIPFQVSRSITRRCGPLGALLLICQCVSAQNVTRGPYLQSATSSSIIVRWRTDQAISSRVRFGASPSALTRFADGDSTTTEHIVRLGGLEASTRYFYSVGSRDETGVSGGSDQHFTTTPPIGERKRTRIWAIGDSGRADADAAAVRDSFKTFTRADPADLWLMLGDNAYFDGTDNQYQAAVFDMYPDILKTTPLWPAFGNHDAHSTTTTLQAGPYYDIFSLPTGGEAGGAASGTEAYYAFDFGSIHFVCIDSEDSSSMPGGPMLTWLERDLARADPDWTIAYFHHPPYTKGTHDSDNPLDSGGRMERIRVNVLPVLDAGGVDLVLSGHSHNYERSFLIDGHHGNSTTLAPRMILDAGDGRFDGSGPYLKPSAGAAPNEGTVYIVAGNAGRGPASPGPLDHPVIQTVFRGLGSVIIDVERNQMDVRMIDGGGSIRDHFTILKGTTGTGAASNWARYE